MLSVGHPELAFGSQLALGRMAREQDDQAEAARYLLQVLRLADTLSVDKSQSDRSTNSTTGSWPPRTKATPDGLDRLDESTLNLLSGPNWMHNACGRRGTRVESRIAGRAPLCRSPRCLPSAPVIGSSSTSR